MDKHSDVGTNRLWTLKKRKENALVGVSENVYWAFLGILKKKKLV